MQQLNLRDKRLKLNTKLMNGENWLLVTYELVEFEKLPVEIQNFREFTDHFRGIYRRYLKLTMKKLKNNNM